MASFILALACLGRVDLLSRLPRSFPAGALLRLVSSGNREILRIINELSPSLIRVFSAHAFPFSFLSLAFRFFLSELKGNAISFLQKVEHMASVRFVFLHLRSQFLNLLNHL